MRKSKPKGKPMILWYGKLFYSAGTLSYAAPAQTVFGLLMLFAADALRVPAYLVGIAMAIGFVISAVADPMVGYLSGRTRSVMFGKRFAFILIGIFLTALFNALLWTMPQNIHIGLKFLWLVVFLALMNISISALSVPHAALIPELSGDLKEQNVINNYKKVFFLIAISIPTLLLGFLIRDTKSADGYVTLALINSCIVIIAGLLAFFASYPHLPRLNAKFGGETAEKLTLKQIYSKFFYALKERSCRFIMLGYTVSMMSAAFMTGAGLLFMRYTMNFTTAAMAGALSVLFLFTIISQPAWTYLTKKFDKKTLILSGTITALFGILVICILFVVYHYAGAAGNPLYLFIAAAAIIGAGSGAMHSIPSHMLADLDAEKRKKGDFSQPEHTGFMNFMFKGAQGLVMLLTGALISIFGFNGAAATQSGLTTGALGWIVVLGASLSLGAAVYLYMQVGRKKPQGGECKAAETMDMDKTDSAEAAAKGEDNEN